MVKALRGELQQPPLRLQRPEPRQRHLLPCENVVHRACTPRKWARGKLMEAVRERIHIERKEREELRNVTFRRGISEVEQL